MITVTNIRNAKPENFDEIWAVVRSLKNPGRMIQVQALSPSWYLFKQYMSLKDAGKWNHDSFEQIYVPTFLREMKAPAAHDAFENLINTGAKRNIAAVCFCTDQTLCHTSILAGMLQYRGIEINGALHDYSQYGRMFEEMQ